jgi:hypothetical protein
MSEIEEEAAFAKEVSDCTNEIRDAIKDNAVSPSLCAVTHIIYDLMSHADEETICFMRKKFDEACSNSLTFLKERRGKK